MAERYVSADGVLVEAELLDEDDDVAAAGNWKITDPDGEVRYMHDSIFADSYKPEGDVS